MHLYNQDYQTALKSTTERDFMGELAINMKETDDILDRTNELLINAKDASVFNELYELWFIKVFQYTYVRVGNNADAEDLTSDIFLKVYESFSRYKHQGSFPAWLFTIARNEINMFYRWKKKTGVKLDAVLLTDPAESMLKSVMNSGELDQLNSIIKKLPEDERELLNLRYVAEMRFSDMALVLKKKEDTVKKSLYRLQARMQKDMEVNYE